MTFGSLFSGVGGFDLGLERAGMECAWQVEIDPQARRVLDHHWSGVPRHEDIRTVGRKCLARVDVVCGGFPCQDLSTAGQRAGLAGDRSGLFWQMLRIVDALRPRVLVAENVPGLLASDSGRDFARVLRGLADCGYSAVWRVLDAQFFGLAQRRKRVFIVAARGRSGADRAAQILALTRSGGRRPPAGGPAREDIAGAITGGSRNRGGHNARDESGLTVAPTIAATLRSRQHSLGVSSPGRGGEDDANLVVSHTRQGVGHDASDDGTGRGTPLVVAPFDERNITSRVNRSTVGDGRPSPTLHAGGMSAVRRLMPVECLRLQGFPDDWLDLGPPLSDSAKYRTIGNAVAVPVAAWIGRRVADVLGEAKR